LLNAALVGGVCVCVCVCGTASARWTIIARREFIITASALIVTLPLSLYRNITRLVKVSITSLTLALAR